MLQCFSLSLFLIPPLIASFFFYTLFSFHLHPPRAGQMVSLNTYPISTFLKSLGSSCKAENHCLGITSILIRPRVSCRAFNAMVSNFSLDILELPQSYVFVILIRVNRISWNVPLDGRPTLLSSALVSRGGIHPRLTFLGPYDQN